MRSRRVQHPIVFVAAVLLGCAPGVEGLRADAWGAPADLPAPSPPLDCSAFDGESSASRVGERLKPGPGRALRRPADLGAGPVRRVWSSSVGGAQLEWVAPVGEAVQMLWLLRVATAGRCVVGTWGSPGLPTEVLKHAFTPDGRTEVVILGLGHPPDRLWMALATDGSSLWSALGNRNESQAAVVGDQAELREKDARLLLVTTTGPRVGVLYFDGFHFGTRP